MINTKEKPISDSQIPANIRYSCICNWAKLLYSDIKALSYEKGFCFASNRYLWELYWVEPRTIIRWIKVLQLHEFIKTEIDQKAGNNRKIYLVTKMSVPSDKNVSTLVTKMSVPSDKNVTHINTDIIIDINNKEIIKEETGIEEDKKIIDNIDDLRRFLNKWKLMEEYYYKIWTEESFECVTNDFFMYCEDKGRKINKNTVEGRFKAYLKPKWETEEMRNEMIIAYKRNIQKKKYSRNEIKKHDEIVKEEEDKKKREYEERKKEAKEIEKNLSPEEKDWLWNVAWRETMLLLKKNNINPLVIEWYYNKLLLGIQK